jgi:methyl-accepting chemotaxis protein
MRFAQTRFKLLMERSMTAFAITGKNREPSALSLFSFHDRKISSKIMLGFSAVLAIGIALSGFSYVSLDKIDTNFRSYSHKVLLVGMTRNVERDFLGLCRQIREFGLTGEERLLEEARKLRQIVAEGVDAAVKEIKNPGRHAKMVDAAEKYGLYADQIEKLATTRHNLNHMVKDVLDPLGKQILAEAERMQNWAVNKDGNLNTVALAGDVIKNVMQVRLNATKTLGRRDKESMDNANKFVSDLRASLSAFGVQATSDEARKYFGVLSALTNQYYEAFQTGARDAVEIERMFNGAMAKASAAMTADLESINQTAADDEQKVGGETEDYISFSERLSLLIGVAGLAIGAALAWLIGRAISNPVKKMTDAMTSLASGHLDVEVPARGNKDEIGEMAEAVQVFKDAAIAKIKRDAEVEDERRKNQEAQRRAEEEAIRRERELVCQSIGAGLTKLSAKDLTYRMTDEVPEAYRRLQQDFNSATAQLEAAMGAVVEGADAIGSGANQIAVAADDLSRRTEQQAASLEETAAALEEITVTVKKAAEGAGHAATIVGTTKLEAGKSGQIVRQAVDAMGRIEKSSQEISQIIGVIDEIAFQTNLLALNAGVEAARAGDAGKGFAVVASEVRALAQRSAEAAKEIKDLISTSSSQVGQGVDLVDRTGKALEKILVQVTEIDRVVAEIASGAREQATSLTEVNVAVSHMDQTTQQNAAMVEETTAATHSLRRESDELMNEVRSFCISRQTASKSAAPSRDRLAKPATTRVSFTSVAGRGKEATVRKAAAAAEQDSWEEF